MNSTTPSALSPSKAGKAKEAYIGREGALYDGAYTSWKSLVARLKRVTLLEPEPMALEFVVEQGGVLRDVTEAASIISDDEDDVTTSHKTLRIPVPRGREDDARREHRGRWIVLVSGDSGADGGERDPQEIDTRAHLGQCLLRLRRPQEARPLLEGVVDENPKHDYGYSMMALAETLTALGEKDAALHVWKRVTQNPMYPRAKVQLAELMPSAAAGRK